VWTIHLALVAALCILAGFNVWGRGSSVISLAALSGPCLASLALTGHTQEQEGLSFLVRVAADGAHLLAAGAWLGGLVALLAVLPSRAATGDRSESEIGHVLMRFSGMGYGAVALLVATGLVNTWYLVPSLSQLPASPYGQLLIIKLGLFGLMLLLAAMNRFWLVPTIAGPSTGKNIIRLRHHVIGEQLLGVFIIALVSVLGTLAPFGEQ
jgi:putative copper resistance protein D